MRTLTQMSYDDAKATVREAEDIKAHRALTVKEAALLATALGTIRRLEGSSEEKAERRSRWERRKEKARLKALTRPGRKDLFGEGHRQ